MDGEDVLGQQLVDLKHVCLGHPKQLLERRVAVDIPLVLRVLQVVPLDVLPQLLHNLQKRYSTFNRRAKQTR